MIRAVSGLAIEVRDLRKHYAGRAVLDGVRFEVPRGTLAGLIGPNGAGKTTLLRTLVGIVRRDAGSLSVLGLDPARDSLAIRANACYLPGETSVYHQMTGRGFLDFALSFYGARDQGLLEDLADGFRLPLERRIRGYSAGMKQKLSILATLVPDVDLYLLDEPDRALDASMRFLLRDVLMRRRRQGRTILLSSHHLSEVETLADRIDFLVEGRLVPPGDVAAARERLRRQIRLRIDGPWSPPPGARLLRTEADGTLVLLAEGEPLSYASRLPPERVQALELGAVRLEELYQLLTGANCGGELT
ncbi:MAG: ABC transporter ATP-binding protein [Planctomycetota bacterium]